MLLLLTRRLLLSRDCWFHMSKAASLLQKMIRLVKSTGRSNPAPDDVRGRCFVAVIDCILNQNARDAGAARFPAMNFELLRLCHENQVGILQMPCPEIAALGFNRSRAPGKTIRDDGRGLSKESGVFMKELQAEFQNRRLEATFKGIRDHDPELLEQDLRWFRDLLVEQQASIQSGRMPLARPVSHPIHSQ